MRATLRFTCRLNKTESEKYENDKKIALGFIKSFEETRKNMLLITGANVLELEVYDHSDRMLLHLESSDEVHAPEAFTIQ